MYLKFLSCTHFVYYFFVSERYPISAGVRMKIFHKKVKKNIKMTDEKEKLIICF